MELTCIPRDGTVLGSPGLTPVVPTAIPLSHLSLVFCQLFRLLFYAKAQSQSLCISPLPLRKQQCLCEGRESPAFSSNPDSVHHVAWSKIVVLFFINFFVPQSLIWKKKKKGMDPVVESNLGALHAAWCYTFLGIYVSGCQCFHSHPAATPGRWKPCSALCWEAELFSFQKTLQSKQVGCACSPGTLGTAPRETARVGSLRC